MEMDNVRKAVERYRTSDREAEEHAVGQQPVASSSKLPDEPRLNDLDTNGADQDVTEYTDEDYRQERAELEQCEKRIDDYLKLHQSIKSSKELLNNLSSFLNTFQSDLSEVSGQISELQGKSKAIDRQLEGRRAIAQPLNSLIKSLVIPPELIYLIRDTVPGETWIPAIAQLERKIWAVRARGKVRASHEVGMVVEGLKTKAIVSIRQYLLDLIRPLRASVRTNIQVVQTTILLKYRSLFQFLHRHAPKVAEEVQRAYVVSARAYYETCFRRYARSLGLVKARSTEPRDLVGAPTISDAAQALLSGRLPGRTETPANGAESKTPAMKAEEKLDRLKFAKLDAEPVILGFQAEDKTFVQPVEAVFRSLLLVLLDNASSEFTFLVRFFAATLDRPSKGPAVPRSNSVVSVGNTASPSLRSVALTRKDSAISMVSSAQGESAPSEGLGMNLRDGDADSDGGTATPSPDSAQKATSEPSKEALRLLEVIWKQVMETAVEYCKTLFDSCAEPLAPPPAIPLLTMIRLNDAAMAEANVRGCIPMEGICMGLKLSMWPIFQKEMNAQVDSVKKLADAAVGGGFGAMLNKGPKDSAVRQVCERYADFFSYIVALSSDEDEAMVFTSMNRLRTELSRLTTTQSQKIKSPSQQASFLVGIYDDIIRGLTTGPGRTSHPRLQTELSFFRTREEEAKRRV